MKMKSFKFAVLTAFCFCLGRSCPSPDPRELRAPSSLEPAPRPDAQMDREYFIPVQGELLPPGAPDARR